MALAEGLVFAAGEVPVLADLLEEAVMASLSEVVAAGDTLAALEAVRDQIAADLDKCDSMRDRAALYLRLADILKAVDAIRPAEVKGDPVDEIAARRTARRSGSSAHSARAK